MVFAGNWSTIEVIKDGDLQSEWANTQLIIKQESEKGGKYQMINTPYDSIWSANGNWTITTDPNTFLIDNSITVFYIQKNDTLYLTKFLPWTSIPCNLEKEPVCPTVVTGQWDFKLKRE